MNIVKGLTGKKQRIILLLAIIPYFIWFVMSLTIMHLYIEIWEIVLVSFFALVLSICTSIRYKEAKMIVGIILSLLTAYLIYEGLHNPYFAIIYPFFLFVIWIYYIVLNIISMRDKV